MIRITYRFNPHYFLSMWEPFRWIHEDGTDATPAPPTRIRGMFIDFW